MNGIDVSRLMTMSTREWDWFWERLKKLLWNDLESFVDVLHSLMTLAIQKSKLKSLTILRLAGMIVEGNDKVNFISF